MLTFILPLKLNLLTHDFDVALVGVGPTRAVPAHLLKKRVLSVLVLEREPTFYGNVRAAHTNDERAVSCSRLATVIAQLP